MARVTTISKTKKCATKGQEWGAVLEDNAIKLLKIILGFFKIWCVTDM